MIKPGVAGTDEKHTLKQVTRVNIVLPCYNPPQGWHERVKDFYAFARPRWDLHFIVVNDGSSNKAVAEDARAALQPLPFTLLNYDQNKGKGYALRQGVAAAPEGFILYTDIDMPFTNQSIENLMEVISSGNCDIAAGFRDKNYYLNNMSAFRRRLSQYFRWFMKHGLRISMHDTQCGLKAFNKAGKDAFMRTRINRYLFDFEFIYLALRSGKLTVKGVPVELQNNITFTRMRTSVLLREGVNLLCVLYRAAISRKNNL